MTSEVVAYSDQYEHPVLVLEDLTHMHENMDYGALMNRRLHGRAYARLHAQVRYKAAMSGIRVGTGDPVDTLMTSQNCGETGNRSTEATSTCTNAECWVSEHQAHVNVALNSGGRYLSGESPSGEDTSGDDSAAEWGRSTVPQDSQADADPR